MNTVEMLERLVAFDTTSRDSNLELIDLVESHLEAAGVSSRRVWSPDRTKANLWATIGPAVAGGVVVSGHTDCVPVDGQAWTTDPFALTLQGDRLVGRGTADMKGFVASALVAVERWTTQELKRPIHLALSYDEEVGGAGARPLVADMAAANLRPDYCIVGEPSSMQVVTAHKGIETYVATISGTEIHSSLAPRAVNAVEFGARLVTALSDLADQRAAEGPFDDDFDVPHTTIHPGVIHGGTALNIVARLCEVELEFRYLPGESPDALRTKIEGIAAEIAGLMPDINDVGIIVRRRAGFPDLDTPQDSPAVAAVEALTPVAGTSKVAYGTEAGLFAEALNAPTIVCGPGAIAVAHKPDEYVELEQLETCDSFMDALGESLTE
ncbi:MAG: acetylornithine deacetylase [bacterium]|nr:acetylornithine deacetylase [bacterium]